MVKNLSYLLNLAFFILFTAPAIMAQEQSGAENAAAARPKVDEIKETSRTDSAAGRQMLEPKYDTFEQKAEKQLNEIQSVVKLVGNVEEKNLAIEWNDWHNRFSQAVRRRVFTSLFETINFRKGVITFYRCQVSSDRHIKDLSIVRSSGDFWYDSAVLKAVNKLDGDEILAFPAQSRRSAVVTEVGIQLGGPRLDNLNFGDVEYREALPEELPDAGARKSGQPGHPSVRKKKHGRGLEENNN